MVGRAVWDLGFAGSYFLVLFLLTFLQNFYSSEQARLLCLVSYSWASWGGTLFREMLPKEGNIHLDWAKTRKM